MLIGIFRLVADRDFDFCLHGVCHVGLLLSFLAGSSHLAYLPDLWVTEDIK